MGGGALLLLPDPKVWSRPGIEQICTRSHKISKLRLTSADVPIKISHSQAASTMAGRMDCEQSSRMLFCRTGFEIVEVKNLKSEVRECTEVSGRVRKYKEEGRREFK